MGTTSIFSLQSFDKFGFGHDDEILHVFELWAKQRPNLG
jgi:hypothetical protein